MRSLTKFADWLRLPEAPKSQGANESHVRLAGHSQVLQQKPAFRSVVEDIHQRLFEISNEWSLASGRTLEIGAGVIPLQGLFVDAISSDIELGEDIDIVLDVHTLPFSDTSFANVVCQNSFHHFKDPLQALAEVSRVLLPGGALLLVEPSGSWFASKIFPALFNFEGYDRDAQNLQYLRSGDAIIPNQALSYVAFAAMLDENMDKFSGLSVVHTEHLPMGLRYLLTGGLNFRSLLPAKALKYLAQIESSRLFGHLFSYLSLHWLIVLQKK